MMFVMKMLLTVSMMWENTTPAQETAMLTTRSSCKCDTSPVTVGAANEYCKISGNMVSSSSELCVGVLYSRWRWPGRPSPRCWSWCGHRPTEGGTPGCSHASHGTVTHILLPTRRGTASSRLNHLTGECNQLKLNYNKPTLCALCLKVDSTIYTYLLTNNKCKQK